MNNDPRNLFAAVKKAAGKKLNIDKYNDRLMMQKGCYILNRWDHGPIYRYRLYIKGPYSSELAEDYDELGYFNDMDTDVPDSSILRLSEIIKRGKRYMESYTTILLVEENNHGISADYVLRKTLEIRPELKDEIEEAFTSIQM